MKKFKDMTTAQKAYGAAAIVVGGTLLLPDFAHAGRSLLPSQMAKDIMEAYGISHDLALAIAEAADDLHVDAYALANVINFESGFNPQAVNPSSGASGLIQFMPRTATGLGTSVGTIRGMSALQQMAATSSPSRRFAASTPWRWPFSTPRPSTGRASVPSR